jgi:hypothetical protein
VMLFLLACAHTVPPAAPGVPESLRESVQQVANAPTNYGRRKALMRRADDLSLATDTEWIDWFSTQKNVLIELPGAPEGDIVYVVAHYDKVDLNLLSAVSRLVNGALDPLIAWSFMTDGAVDNASGVSVVLQLAAALSEQEHRTTFRFLLAGHEEAGLRGTRAHVARLSPEEKARITLAVNVDTIGILGVDNCVYDDHSDPEWVARLQEAALEEGRAWGTASIPGGATSDHVVFMKNSAALDIGRGCLFGGPGGLLPQRSWFTSRSSAPVLFVSACEVMDAGDLVAGCCLVPTGNLHGPRDRADKVDPEGLYEAYRVLLNLLSEVD